MKLSALLALVGIAPKNPDEARAVREASKMKLEEFAAMFSAAGLDAEQLLAAGPDSLKAHLVSLDQKETIAALEQQVAQAATARDTLNAQLSTLNSDLDVTRAALDAHKDLLAATGFKAEASAKPEELKAAFAAHVARAATAKLATLGHPPVAEVQPEQVAAAVDADAAALQAWQAYNKFAAGSKEKAEFYEANADAIWRGRSIAASST